MLGKRWKAALLLSSGRLAFDFGTLLACIRATGVKPNPSLVLLAYAVAGLLALIPITPGGLGIVEAGLSALLILAGMPGVDAVVATLAYRIISYWLPIFVGPFAYVAFRLALREARGPWRRGGRRGWRGSGTRRGLRGWRSWCCTVVVVTGEQAGGPRVRGDLGVAADAPGTGLVRRRQARDLHPLGPLLGAGLGAAGARHSAAARQGRAQADAAGEPVRRVVPQHHADSGQPHRAAPRPGLRRGLPLRQLRAHLRRRLVRRRPRRPGRRVPGGGGALRRPHHQAPRRLRPVALGRRAPGQGRVPGPPRPGGRSERGGAGAAHAHGALLLRRVRLALQRRGADHRRRRRAGRATRLRGTWTT